VVVRPDRELNHVKVEAPSLGADRPDEYVRPKSSGRTFQGAAAPRQRATGNAAI
jgi:hypothetical protein